MKRERRVKQGGRRMVKLPRWRGRIRVRRKRRGEGRKVEGFTIDGCSKPGADSAVQGKRLWQSITISPSILRNIRTHGCPLTRYGRLSLFRTRFRLVFRRQHPPPCQAVAIITLRRQTNRIGPFLNPMTTQASFQCQPKQISS